MKTFKQWLKANLPGATLPEGNINGSWFRAHGLPMIVQCTNCQMTMCIVNAMVDDEDQTFCTDCAGE